MSVEGKTEAEGVFHGPAPITDRTREALADRTPKMTVRLPPGAAAAVLALLLVLGTSAEAHAQGPIGNPPPPPDRPPETATELCERMTALLPPGSKVAEIGCEHAQTTDFIGREVGPAFTDVLRNILGKQSVGTPIPTPDHHNPLTDGVVSLLNLVKDGWNALLKIAPSSSQ